MERDSHYRASYTKTLDTLELQIKHGDLDIEKVRNELRSLYVYEDHGWAGRGMVKDAEISGAIAAYEAFLKNLSDGIA